MKLRSRTYQTAKPQTMQATISDLAIAAEISRSQILTGDELR